MRELDNSSLIKKFDPDKNLESVDLLADQVGQVWREFKKVKLPENYKKVDRILINAMGGSALPGHMIKSIYFDELKKPLEVINSYKLPAYVNGKTLYLMVSYSGTTEEPLSTYDSAKDSGAKIFGIASGGKLAAEIKRGRMPGYVFDPKANPSNQPRIGLGYTLAAHLGLFSRLGFIKITDLDIKKVLAIVSQAKKEFGFSNPFAKNKAKQLAVKIKNKALIVVASEHLAGSAHVFANQTNETAKTLSAYHLISELNHHLLEGLRFPSVNQRNLIAVSLDSYLYHPKNRLRYKITKEVIAKNKV
ncbi:hypothetical protein HYZ76_01985, partial [Candidatus Falkowbacteria bacterium]|nr:hypothetical protein [Candidatus Falkowbacteria bacterium]